MIMNGSEQYIGVPNGVVLCYDKTERYGLLHGRLFHGYSVNAEEVRSYEEMILKLDRFFDEIQFPRAAIRQRSFVDEPKQETRGRERKERVMSDKELLTKHGELGTFIIRVQQRQNSTWQGRLTWVDEDKTMRFRSALEMIKLIESAIAEDDPAHLEEQEPTWED